MSPQFYRHAGLTIASQLALSEWAPFACAPAAPDLRFDLHSPAPLADDHFHVESEICQFTIPDVAHFRVSEGRIVAITPAPGAGERELRLFLLGSAWSIANYQRGNFPLHAGVVRVGPEDNAGCIAFCGASGAGKSSAVAWLLGERYQLWSDDLAICDLDGPPRVWPSTRRLKLWRESLDALGRGTDGLERDHFRQEKFHWPIETPDSLAHAPPLPLRAIYLLDWGDADGECACLRLRGIKALDGFVEAATYRGTILNDMGAAASYWEQCAHIARHVPVFRLTRPRDWAQLPDAMRPITRYWKP